MKTQIFFFCHRNMFVRSIVSLGVNSCYRGSFVKTVLAWVGVASPATVLSTRPVTRAAAKTRVVLKVHAAPTPCVVSPSTDQCVCAPRDIRESQVVVARKLCVRQTRTVSPANTAVLTVLVATRVWRLEFVVPTHSAKWLEGDLSALVHQDTKATPWSSANKVSDLNQQYK